MTLTYYAYGKDRYIVEADAQVYGTWTIHSPPFLPLDIASAGSIEDAIREYFDCFNLKIDRIRPIQTPPQSDEWLVSTVAIDYPLFTGEFRLKATGLRDQTWVISCQPFSGDFQVPGPLLTDAITGYFAEFNTQVTNIMPIITNRNFTQLPTDGPFCYIGCSFAPNLTLAADGSKFYRCEMPTRFEQFLVFTVKIESPVNLATNIDARGQQLAEDITPQKLADLIVAKWPNIKARVVI